MEERVLYRKVRVMYRDRMIIYMEVRVIDKIKNPRFFSTNLRYDTKFAPPLGGPCPIIYPWFKLGLIWSLVYRGSGLSLH